MSLRRTAHSPPRCALRGRPCSPSPPPPTQSKPSRSHSGACLLLSFDVDRIILRFSVLRISPVARGPDPREGSRRGRCLGSRDASHAPDHPDISSTPTVGGIMNRTYVILAVSLA